MFYKTFFWNIPKERPKANKDLALSKVLVPEWELLERTADTTASIKKESKLNRESWKGGRVDVATMFETASAIIDMERGLNMISFVAVIILFFVILIGVVNTMRMSIRERTREIGTNRAIGMQRTDVRSVFVFEVVFLSFFACIAGILLSFGLMTLLSSITFDVVDNSFSMFLVKKHMYFLPTIEAGFITFGIIMFISYIISYFTARHAAKMRPADALRHYE